MKKQISNGVKTFLYSIFALVLTLPLAASAATFSFVPSTGKVAPGDTFNVTVYVNPSTGEEITTAKLSTTFPADILEVVSFTQATSWMALTQPGYDSMNSPAGTMVKTGGYPARVKSSQQFGTMTLKAKSAGTATLAVAGDSMLLDATNANKHTGSAGATFVVEAPVVEAPPTPEPVITPAPTTAPTPTPTTVEEPVIEDEATTTEDVATSSTSTEDQLAAAATADTGLFGTNKSTWYYILALMALLLVGWTIYRKRENNS